jgi:hypothetical protein
MHLYVHRLVAEAFHKKPAGKEHVNHIDADTGNNRSENLAWVTPKENVHHSVALGRQKFNWRKGMRPKVAKFSKSQVLEIRDLAARGDITKTAIAARFGCGISTISRIVRREVYIDI